VKRAAPGLCLLAFAPAWAGEEILDQVHEPNGAIASNVKITADKAQTFTAGISGLLSRVDVFVRLGGGRSDLVVDVRPTKGGVPAESDTDVLASFRVPAAAVREAAGNVVSLDTRPFGIVVRSGEVLAIALGTDGGFYSFLGGGEYSGGARYFRRPDIGFVTWERDDSLGDFGFRTFVVPGRGVPAASGWVLGALAALLAGAGAGLSRRQDKFRLASSVPRR
jgi:hypothetical protein